MNKVDRDAEINRESGAEVIPELEFDTDVGQSIARYRVWHEANQGHACSPVYVGRDLKGFGKPLLGSQLYLQA